MRERHFQCDGQAFDLFDSPLRFVLSAVIKSLYKAIETSVEIQVPTLFGYRAPPADKSRGYVCCCEFRPAPGSVYKLGTFHRLGLLYRQVLCSRPGPRFIEPKVLLARIAPHTMLASLCFVKRTSIRLHG